VKISGPDAPDRLSHRLALLLGLGTWASCGLIAAGIVLPVSGANARSHAQHLVWMGIVLLLVLPTLRVAMMGTWFLFHREPAFALISALVLVIIIASTLLGTGTA
jgi:Protein of unknown function (DUF1634)